MQIIDSHCHINFEPLAENIPALLANAHNMGVSHMLLVSVDMEDYPQIQALSTAHPEIFCSVGVHPNSRDGREPDIDELVQLGHNEHVVAVGETGLDYFRSEGDLSWQHERFHRHIEAARQLNKPLIVHTREAADDTVSTLKAHRADEAGGVIHCFAEDWRIAEQVLDLGFYISFSGIVTFKSAQAVQEVARRMPLDRMLVETDSPYLAPVPHRGKTNEPAYVRHVAEFIADLRGESLDTIAAHTTENFFRLFHNAAPHSRSPGL